MITLKKTHFSYSLLGENKDGSFDLVDMGEVKIELTPYSDIADLLEEQFQEVMTFTFGFLDNCRTKAPYISLDLEVNDLSNEV